MVNPYEPPASPLEAAADPEASLKRHGCLTAYLVFMIIANSTSVLSYILLAVDFSKYYPTVNPLVFFTLVICGVANLVFAIALLKYRRWGFIGFIVSSLIVFGLNMYVGIGIGRSLMGLGGVVLLFALLHVGGPRRAWPRLT